MNPTLTSLAAQQSGGMGGEGLWSLLMMNPGLMQQFFGGLNSLQGFGLPDSLPQGGGMTPGGDFGTTGTLTDPQGQTVPEFNDYQHILAGGGPGSLGQPNPPVSGTNVVSNTVTPGVQFPAF